jgi:Flp pilus assembly protein TadG
LLFCALKEIGFMKRYFKKLARLCKKNQGSVLVETAFVIPILAFLVVAGFDVTQFVVANQKMNRLAATMADLISRSDEGINEAVVSDLLLAADFAAAPYDLKTSGRVIITAIQGTNGGNQIVWQRCNTSTYTSTSSLGTTGKRNVTLPGGLTLDPGEISIVSEAVLRFDKAFVSQIAFPDEIRQYAIFRPRLGALNNVVADGSQARTC